MYDLTYESPDFLGRIDMAAALPDMTPVRCKAVQVTGGMTPEVTASAGGAYDFAKAFTVEAWIDPTALGAGFQIVEHGTSMGMSGYQLVVDATGELVFHAWTVAGDVQASGAGNPPLNRWSHVAGVFDPENGLMGACLNGRCTYRLIMMDWSVAGNGANLVLADRMSGYLDEVRLSDVARYTGDGPPDSSFSPDGNTVALYHFDGDGSDLSSHMNTASLQGGAAFVANAPCY